MTLVDNFALSPLVATDDDVIVETATELASNFVFVAAMSVVVSGMTEVVGTS